MTRSRALSQLRFIGLTLGVVCVAGAPARAGEGRLVLGSHDAALASALSVAVSPRGLSVVELPEPLARASDVEAARHELAVQDAAAVVWLCDDDAGAHALCFCGRDGQLVVRPVSLTSPLAPPDAAALALTVKVLLGSVRPPPPPAPPAPAPPPRPPATPHERATGSDIDLPALTLEISGGARIQSRTPSLGARFGLASVFAPDAFHRQLAFGLGLGAGPQQSVNDVALRGIARVRLRARPLWIELDLAPSTHFLSVEIAGVTTHRAQLSIDARVGAVLTLGPYFTGLRAAALFVPAPSAAPTLPRWSGEAVLFFGANVL